MNFSSFSFDRSIVEAISRAGYAEPTDIQARAIGPVLEGSDVLGLAQTGTGKTAAFALPILQRLMKGQRCTARALILSPTRELAEQTRKTFEMFGKAAGIKAISIYGGVSQTTQMRSLKRDLPEVIVACPGRLLDLLDQRVISLKNIETLVLDEADQMFDMGFLPTVRKIIESLPAPHQTLMFSATFPQEIRALAREFQREPVLIEVGSSSPVETVRHVVCPVSQTDKYAALSSLLSGEADGSALIFARTKHRAKRLAIQLSNSGYSAVSLHGNLSQGQRDKAMRSFRNGEVRLMVATDIAARGIDIRGIAYVINFDMPDTAEAYTHRIGRTGRMHLSGVAMSFATPEDKQMLRVIERLVDQPIERKYIEVARNNDELATESPARSETAPIRDERAPAYRDSPARRGEQARHDPSAPRDQRAQYQNRPRHSQSSSPQQRPDNRQRPENFDQRNSSERQHRTERPGYQEDQRGSRTTPHNSQRNSPRASYQNGPRHAPRQQASQRGNRRDFGQHSKEFASIP